VTSTVVARARWKRSPLARRHPGPLTYGLLMILAALFAAPLLWMVSTSLKTEAQAIATPPALIPGPFVWANYAEALSKINFPLALRNTLIYVIPSVVGAEISCSLVAYGFARLRWPGRNLVFIIVLATMMLPSQVTFIPLYVTYAKLGWVGTFLPLIVPAFFGSPFLVFLLRQFFLGIPAELCDAARIDGASELRILTRIVVPLSWPALITVGLFTLVDKWTDFFNPLIYLRDPALRPLSLAVQVFQSSHTVDWPLSMAASVAITAPLVVVYFFAQRKFLEGIALSGIKG
jgi:multiple sugar transport system permease protein